MKEAHKKLEFNNSLLSICIKITDDNNNSFLSIIKFFYST
jgi:hypothetical protein